MKQSRRPNIAASRLANLIAGLTEITIFRNRSNEI
jgi:hypothetical protein